MTEDNIYKFRLPSSMTDGFHERQLEQPTTSYCLFCNMRFVGTFRTAREWAAEHRARFHPTVRQPRRPRPRGTGRVRREQW